MGEVATGLLRGQTERLSLPTGILEPLGGLVDVAAAGVRFAGAHRVRERLPVRLLRRLVRRPRRLLVALRPVMLGDEPTQLADQLRDLRRVNVLGSTAPASAQCAATSR